jgi:hypothetical protein
MKQTKAVSVLFGLFVSMMLASPVKAVTVVQINPNVEKNIQLLPTATPTLIPIKIIHLNLPTATPTLSLIKLPIKLRPIATLTPTAAKSSPTSTATAVVTAPATATAVPTTAAVNNQTGNNMTFWFLLATVGLLAVIIIVQAWPKKDEEE